MAGSTLGSEMPPHPYGPYHSGNEGRAPNSFPRDSRRHGSPDYFGHPDIRGYYSGEAPAETPPPPYARAFRGPAPPPLAPTTDQHDPRPPMAAPPASQTDNSDTSRCGGGRRRGWWLWGSSCPDKEASPGHNLPADYSPPGAGSHSYYRDCPFSAGRRGHHPEMPAGSVTGEAEKAAAGPTADPRKFGPFPGDGSRGPPFHGHGFPGDHSGFPGFHGDPSGGPPGYGSGGPPFRGDYRRFGPFGYGHPPFYGYRYPGGFYYGDGRPFQNGPESRYIFREFDFQ